MISDEAVEAAARAAHLRKLTGVRWEDIPKWKKAYRLSEARAALEAAAPHLLAEAWDEGERVGYQNCGCDDWGLPTTPNPYRGQA